MQASGRAEGGCLSRVSQPESKSQVRTAYRQWRKAQNGKDKYESCFQMSRTSSVLDRAYGSGERNECQRERSEKQKPFMWAGP